VDGYGTVGVFAGKALDHDQWQALIDSHSQGNYVVQEYCQQFPSANTLPIPPGSDGQPLFTSAAAARDLATSGDFDPLALADFNILTGLFCYGGQYAGNFIRAGRHALIVGFQGGISLGALISDDDASVDTASEPSGNTNAPTNSALQNNDFSVLTRHLT
jgi:hypothetical protein